MSQFTEEERLEQLQAKVDALKKHVQKLVDILNAEIEPEQPTL